MILVTKGALLLKRKIEEHLLTGVIYAWSIFIICFILPATFFTNGLKDLRNRFILAIRSAPVTHRRKTAIIQRQIREWNNSGRKTKMCTARPSWMATRFRYPWYKESCTLISTDELKDILEINIEEQYVHVEPMVTVGQIIKCLIPNGYTLPVVPELQELTVGGLINGCGIGSSSIKYSLFQELCLSYELVMADGSLISTAKAKAKTNAPTDDLALFYGIPWSHGTIGFVVSAKLKIIPCKPFVKITYIPCDSKEIMFDTLNEEVNNRDNEFVEGIHFSRESGVVIKGVFSKGPAKNETSSMIGTWREPAFYRHVMEIGKQKKRHVEYVPLLQYYYRHSKSVFWELKNIIPFADSVAFRYLFGWALPPKISFLKATNIAMVRSHYERHHIDQGLMVPMNRLSETIDFVDLETEIYPLWLCPFVLHPNPGFLRQKSGRKLMFCAVGIYGSCPNQNISPPEAIKKIEKFLCSNSGFKMLYGDCYMSKAEFWDMFDSALYEWLRVKYNSREAFLDVYEKISLPARI